MAQRVAKHEEQLSAYDADLYELSLGSADEDLKAVSVRLDKIHNKQDLAKSYRALKQYTERRFAKAVKVAKRNGFSPSEKMEDYK